MRRWSCLLGRLSRIGSRDRVGRRRRCMSMWNFSFSQPNVWVYGAVEARALIVGCWEWGYRYMRAFRETFARPVRRVRFLGLFDTVNSVPRFEKAWLKRKRASGFPYTARSD
jgi:hypothetical protein